MTFYRYSFIIDATWSEHGVRKDTTIHSLFFCFTPDDDLRLIAIEEATTIFDQIVPDWAITKTGEEGFIPVTASEASGIGFYYLHILVNDRLVRKIHLRPRQERKTFLDTVASTLAHML